jgi:uncharacterized peroxidase-related enzyme
MPYIELPDGVPGIRSLFDYRPETAGPMLALVEVLLRGDNTLSRGERELIASYVSRLNSCSFCAATHGAFAAVQLGDDWDLVDQVATDPASADLSPRLRALLALAEQVQRGGGAVTADAVEAARAEGATDLEVHDTVLIAAAFCMYNRYVDGLATWCPSDDPRDYEPRARALVSEGYLSPVEYRRYTSDQVAHER